MKMWNLIDKILNNFRMLFSRKASFEWFVIIIMGLIIRTDSLGITSIIRDLSLVPNYYTTMNHFFRANSWTIENIIDCWAKTIKEVAPVTKVEGYSLLIGDGVKQGKEGKN